MSSETRAKSGQSKLSMNGWEDHALGNSQPCSQTKRSVIPTSISSHSVSPGLLSFRRWLLGLRALYRNIEEHT